MVDGITNQSNPLLRRVARGVHARSRRKAQATRAVRHLAGHCHARHHLDGTVGILANAQGELDPPEAAEAAFRQRITAAESTMQRLPKALEAGWEPEALTSQYNAAVAEKRAAEAGIDSLQPTERLSSTEIRAMVDELGEMKLVLDTADRGDLAELYEALRLRISYNEKTRVASVDL
ncbi:hypothetical protein OG394_04885 [Kribbella sp. NBC_01245]|uniref:hypothetical protein n=1 Tax=Kribbella sp. NBC_01245 TaxID=2903578 RepID=UPI002E2ADF3D|nr:hypothetical protein [Kribbella sp. NBC_01245]